MNYLQKIKKLYRLSEEQSHGFSEVEITALEQKLNLKLPEKLREYYLTLGRDENLNYTHNRLLKPSGEIDFSEDRFLVFYEENQAVAYWGIKEADLTMPDPPVWGNYGSIESPDWVMESKTTEAFFLLMAVYNGTLGGLKYNANYFGVVNDLLVNYIEKNWTRIPEISWDKQRIYANEFEEVISLAFDNKDTCNAVFMGTSDQDRFDRILNTLEIEWSYVSYEDDDAEEY